MAFNKEKLETRFKEEFEKLNEKQKLAVNTIEGPVMVIAGPGTGKTQILATRIGKILLETDALPENILCLTYTDAGVIAMRKRLIQLIGPDAYKIRIYTFHAFCHDVIQENLSLFEKTALDPVSDLEKIELFKQLIDSFPKDHPLKRYRGDVYYEIKNLDSLFSTMKREGWNPSWLSERIDAYVNDLPNREEFIYKTSRAGKWKKGDLNADYHEALEKMQKLKAAVNEFDHFQQLMRKKNRYDFDDMINWVIKAFKENKNLLARYQEQFLYVLVDEYQDTSGTQNSLVELLINYWDKPNIFVVGDDDQSIYRFQGASLENMSQFANSYKSELITVVLTNNYRSTQPILDLSKALIDRNDDRLVKKLANLDKNLVSSNKSKNHAPVQPMIREYETQRQEMIDITLRVQQLIAEAVPPGKIAVIYKENRYGEELMSYFKLRNIPYYSKRSLNILRIPQSQKIILLLKWLATEHDVPNSGDEMLFEILHFDWFHIPPMEIAKLSIEVSGEKSNGKKRSIRQSLYERSTAPAKDLFDSSTHDGLKRASILLEKLMADVPNTTLQQLFENIIREGGILSFIMQSNDKHGQLQALTCFFDFIKEECRRNPSLSLQDLVKIIELMEYEDLALPLVQVSGSDKGVNLLTAHGAKGLEFQYVFFAGCNAAYWEKKRKPSGGYAFPDTIFTTQSKQGDEEELRRLFYVVLTRAEQHLYISYSHYRNDGKDLEASMFITEIAEPTQLPIEKIFINPEVLSEFAALHFGESQAPEIEKVEEELINRLLDKFVMNVTALNNYLRCPLEFYYKNLIRIPSPKNEATEFGSAVHYTLEQLFRKMLAPTEGQQSDFPSKAEFVTDFEWFMNRHRESFTREQFDRRMEYGKMSLEKYYDKYIKTFNRIVTIERNIQGVTVKNVPIKGKLDKLEFDGKSVNVVDYKTGDPDKATARLKTPSDKDPLGGDYWRQAVFYKLLVDNYSQKDWKVVSAEFDFIEPDKKKNWRKAKLLISPEDTEAVTQQIIQTWQKIQDKDFYVGCGKEDCHWCQFVKTNNLAVSWHDEDEEE